MVVWNDLSNTQWLDYPSQSNILRRTYVNGFLDVSQNIVGRKDMEILGKVGIGTINNSPYYNLDISGTVRSSKGVTCSSISAGYGANTASFIGNTAIGYNGIDNNASIAHYQSNNTTSYALRQDSFGNTTLNAGASDEITFCIGNSTKAVLDRNGDVGIGTNNPAHKLDVNGNINFNSDLYSHGQQVIRNTGNDIYANIRVIRSSSRSDGMYIGYGGSGGTGSHLRFYTNSTGERMTITGGGNIGIHTNNPATRLHFNQGGRPGESSTGYGIRWSSTDHTDYWNLFLSNNGHFRFVCNGNPVGYVDQNDANRQMNFTGQHRTFVKHVSINKVDSYTGLIVSSDQNKYIKMSQGIEKGNKAITINESLPVVSISKTEKDKKCFGVISNAEDEESRTTVAGRFVSNYEKELGDTRIYINSVGEGSIWVSNKNGNLESGDYITSSSIPGYGQKQESEFLANYSVAKITMDCDFQPQLIYKEQIKREVINITQDPGDNIHDISGNYFVENTHELLYGKKLCIDGSGNIEEGLLSDYKNKHYVLDIDASDNLISAQKNILDENGEIQWEDTEEQERAYNIRHVDPSGNIITEEEYNSKIAASEEAYIAAFVGCTYHCG